jgi:hypothetical protein
MTSVYHEFLRIVNGVSGHLNKFSALHKGFSEFLVLTSHMRILLSHKDEQSGVVKSLKSAGLYAGLPHIDRTVDTCFSAVRPR